MKIIADYDKGTFQVAGCDELEKQLLAKAVEGLEIGADFDYKGRSDDSPDGKFVKVHFLSPNGVEFALSGTSEENKYRVNGIRNACFMGQHGGLYFLGQETVDGETLYAFTICYCKECGNPIIQQGRCEWGVCYSCAEKCEHEYVRGAIHGGGLDIGVGEYCSKCGLGKPKDPDEPEKSLVEHHIAVEEELGISIVYKNIPLTPSELLKKQKEMQKEHE